MKKKVVWLSLVLGAAAGMVAMLAGPSRAFDHQDGPGTVADNFADITDVYSFMQPQPDGDGGFAPSGRLVMAMTFAPGIKPGTVLPSNIDYVFRVRTVSSAATLAPGLLSFKVTCNFSGATAPQKLVCVANGTSALVQVEATGGAATDPVRLFAGVRADPAFADVTAFRSTVASGTNMFQNPGTNTFVGKNVMSIVVELDISKVVFAGDAGPKPIFAVAAQTTRL